MIQGALPLLAAGCQLLLAGWLELSFPAASPCMRELTHHTLGIVVRGDGFWEIDDRSHKEAACKHVLTVVADTI